MYQNYVVEVKKNAQGEFEHQVYWLYDEDADKAMLKAKSKYFALLSEACLSNMAEHAVILFTSEGFPMLNECIKKTPVVAQTPVETPTEETGPTEQ